MVGWHHRLDGHEFEQALRVGDGQGGLACCSPWGQKESDMTKQLSWTDSLESSQLRFLGCSQSGYITKTRELCICFLIFLFIFIIRVCRTGRNGGGSGRKSVMVAVVLDAKGDADPPVTLQWLQGGLSGRWIMVQGLLKPSGKSLLTVLDPGAAWLEKWLQRQSSSGEVPPRASAWGMRTISICKMKCWESCICGH